jgi:hypothetical protein
MKLVERFLFAWGAIAVAVLLVVWLPDCAAELRDRSEKPFLPKGSLVEGFKSTPAHEYPGIGASRRRVYRTSAIAAFVLLTNGIIISIHRRKNQPQSAGPSRPWWAPR